MTIPTSAPNPLRHVRELIREGRYFPARALLDAIRWDGRTPAAARLELMQVANEARHFQLVSVLHESFIADGDVPPAAVLLAANAAYYLGDADKAVGLYRQALPHATHRTSTVAKLIERLQQSSGVAAATRELDELLVRYPDVDGTAIRAGLLLGDGNAGAVHAMLDAMPDGDGDAGALLRAMLGDHYLRKGEFGKGFDLVFGLRAQNTDKAQNFDRIAAPLWDGRHFDGPLLVAAERGLGEEIIAASTYQQIHDSGQRLIVQCDQRLIPLFARSMHGMTFVPRNTPDLAKLAVREKNARKCYCLDTCRFYRRSAHDFSAQAPWLVADATRTAAIRSAYTRRWPGKLLVGIVWRSIPFTSGLDDKSCPIEALRSTLSTAGVQFINLQYGSMAEEAERLGASGLPVPWKDPDIDSSRDLDGLAAQVSALDLVISISTSTAHLAGALGRPCWVILPRSRQLFWYWGSEGDRTPVYPRARLFRNASLTEWTGVDAALASSLARLASEHPDAG